MTGVEIAGGEDELGSGVGPDRHLMSDGVDFGDGRAGAVADPEPAVVAQGHDAIAGLVGAFVNGEDRTGELAGLLKAGSGACVEVVDV